MDSADSRANHVRASRAPACDVGRETDTGTTRQMTGDGHSQHTGWARSDARRGGTTVGHGRSPGEQGPSD